MRRYPSRFDARRRAATNVAACSVGFESLEQRRLLSITPALTAFAGNSEVTATPSVTPAATTISVGQAVYVHAMASTDTGGGALTSTEKILSRFDWNFGDTGSPHNNLVGFNAAHQYTKTGLHTVTLTARDEDGTVSSITHKVNVVAAPARTIYVDEEIGDNTNAGTSETAPVQHAWRALELLQDNTRVVFRRGQEHLINRTFDVGDRQNVFIQDWADPSNTGAGKPRLRYTDQLIEDSNGVQKTASSGSGGDIVRQSYAGVGLTVQNIAFESKWVTRTAADGKPIAIKGEGGTAVNAYGRSSVLRDSTFKDIGVAIQTENQNTGVSTATRGVLVQDNSAPRLTDIRGYFSYPKGFDWTIVGNYVENAGVEHAVRTSGNPPSRLLIAHNTLKNPEADVYITYNTLTNTGELENKGEVIALRDVNHAYVYKNQIVDAQARVAQFDTDPGQQRTSEVVVFDANRLLGRGDERYFYAEATASYIMFRNNVVEQAAQVDQSAFEIEGSKTLRIGDVNVTAGGTVSDGGDALGSTVKASRMV